MTPKRCLLTLGFLYFVVMATAAPSATEAADDTKAGTTKPENVEATSSDKEKRSQEEIMFGNQQNKPAGMVDEMVTFPDRKDKASSSDTANATGTAGNASSTESSKDHQDSALDDPKKVERELPTNERDDDDDRFDYYDYLDDGADFRLDDDEYKSGSAGERTDYQYDDGSPLYRKKRNLHSKPGHSRTLRSSLEELLVGGKRLPRRALRFKRDVDMNDLLAMFGALLEQQANDRYYSEDEQAKPYSFLKEVPGASDSEFRSPYELADDSVNDRLLDDRELPYGDDGFSREPAPDWLLGGETVPYPVVRRSAPFYPQDYRHAMVPGHKKRRWEAISREPHSEIGRWGRLVQQNAPPAQSEDDLERFYDLASLLEEAQEDDSP